MSSLCEPVSIECIEKILDQMKNSICHLSYCHNELCDNGFFCKIPYKGKLLPTLIACNHSIGKNVIFNEREFEISFDKNKYRLKLYNGTDRIIYTSMDYDITFIEIKDEDNLDFIHFLEIDNLFFEESSKYFGKFSVYIPHYYLRGYGKCVSYGQICKSNLF